LYLVSLIVTEPLKHLKTLETRRSQCPAEASFAELLHLDEIPLLRPAHADPHHTVNTILHYKNQLPVSSHHLNLRLVPQFPYNNHRTRFFAAQALNYLQTHLVNGKIHYVRLFRTYTPTCTCQHLLYCGYFRLDNNSIFLGDVFTISTARGIAHLLIAFCAPLKSALRRCRYAINTNLRPLSNFFPRIGDAFDATNSCPTSRRQHP
jgi:hypothetical protein